MKNIIILLSITLLVSCNTNESITTNQTKELITTEIKTNQLIPIKLMSIVDDQGLYKVNINDSTTVLIYRGVESCTMIQLH